MADEIKFLLVPATAGSGAGGKKSGMLGAIDNSQKESADVMKKDVKPVMNLLLASLLRGGGVGGMFGGLTTSITTGLAAFFNNPLTWAALVTAIGVGVIVSDINPKEVEEGVNLTTEGVDKGKENFKDFWEWLVGKTKPETKEDIYDVTFSIEGMFDAISDVGLGLSTMFDGAFGKMNAFAAGIDDLVITRLKKTFSWIGDIKRAFKELNDKKPPAPASAESTQSSMTDLELFMSGKGDEGFTKSDLDKQIEAEEKRNASAFPFRTQEIKDDFDGNSLSSSNVSQM